MHPFDGVPKHVCLKEHWGIDPLLKIDLEFSDGQVVCRPSLEESAQVIKSQLDDMALQLTDVQDDCLGAVKSTLTPPSITEDGWSSEPQFQLCRCVLLTVV
jgi:hypothetical protein